MNQLPPGRRAATVLITGANGQLGRELLAWPVAAGLERIGVDHRHCDIARCEDVRQVFAAHRPGLVINAAAYTAVDRAEAEPARAFAVNRDGSRELALACARAGIPLLHVSTDYVFDGGRATPWREADPAEPQGVYGASKLAGEQAVREALAAHLVLRTSWVFGAQGNNFVRTVLRLAATRDCLRVVDDQRGGPTWTGDIAATLLGLAARHFGGESLPWGTFHYAGAPAITWHRFAESIIDEACAIGLLTHRTPVLAIPTREYPTPARRPLNSVLDMSRAWSLLRIAPPDWQAGLRCVLAQWRRDGVRFGA